MVSQSALSLVKYVDSAMVPCDIVAIDFVFEKLLEPSFVRIDREDQPTLDELSWRE